MESVHLPPLKNHLMKDVELGIGKIENVWLALTIGSSITMDSVFPYLTNARPLTSQELVFHATKDIISRMELVNLPPLNNLVMPVAVSGTGMIENV